MTLGRAKAKIRTKHCSIGSIRRTRSTRVGRVIGQSPKAAAVRPAGHPITLVVGRR
jgi:beta-lactam-binding protein with PASTA domain